MFNPFGSLIGYVIYLVMRLIVGQSADISQGGPMADSDDDTTGAWVAFGVMVVVAIIAGVIAYFLYTSAVNSAPS